MSDIQPQFKGNLGMFLVCAELSKLNLIALPTSRNTKGYDIVVLNPETNKSVAIQVKCTDRKDFPILSSHWKDYEKTVDEKILSDFVFVDISDMEKPNYFIVSEENMKDILKTSIKEYSHDYQRRNNLSWEDMLKREEREERKEIKANLWTIKLSQIQQHYKDKWATITNRLLESGK